MAHAILDFKERPQTLVLATGDGAITTSGGSFEFEVRRALREGWDVEVWSWKEQLSGRFARITDPSGARPNVHHLDDHYLELTFVRAGTYTINGASVDVADRVVGKLRIPERLRQ